MIETTWVCSLCRDDKDGMVYGAVCQGRLGSPVGDPSLRLQPTIMRRCDRCQLVKQWYWFVVGWPREMGVNGRVGNKHPMSVPRYGAAGSARVVAERRPTVPVGVNGTRTHRKKVRQLLQLSDDQYAPTTRGVLDRD